MKSSLFSLFTFLCVLFLSSFTQSSTNNVSPSNEAPLSCTLPAPSTFNASSASPTSVSLSWNAVSGASAYQLKVYELTDGGGLTLLTQSVETGLSKNQGGLSSAKNYRFILASICSDQTVSGYIIGNDTHP